MITIYGYYYTLLASCRGDKYAEVTNWHVGMKGMTKMYKTVLERNPLHIILKPKLTPLINY